MPGPGYIAGLIRAAQIAKGVGELARQCGQTGDGPDAADAIAHMIEAEADFEPTPPAGSVMCQCCGQPRPA